jgi:CxxC motif-containing protein (DUF1111 family)
MERVFGQMGNPQRCSFHQPSDSLVSIYTHGPGGDRSRTGMLLWQNLAMHGQGTFFDPRLNDATKFPVAARAGFGNVRKQPDLITPKLSALHFYQLALPALSPPEGSFDPIAASIGKQLFEGKAKCATCHVPPLYTEPGWNLHTAAEIGIDDFQANRAPDGRYRTAPLKGLWTHQKGGFFHDGRFATLVDVVNHYNTVFNLGLTNQEKSALVEFIKSL